MGDMLKINPNFFSGLDGCNRPSQEAVLAKRAHAAVADLGSNADVCGLVQRLEGEEAAGATVPFGIHAGDTPDEIADFMAVLRGGVLPASAGRSADVLPASLWDADDQQLSKRLVHLPVNDDPAVLRKRTDLTNRMLALIEGVREFAIGPELELLAKAVHALDLGAFNQLLEGIIARRKVLA